MSQPPRSLLLIDEPYVSDYLRISVFELALPVVLTPAAIKLGFSDAPGAMTESAAVEVANSAEAPAIYTNSENAIGWIAQHLQESDLLKAINQCKQKGEFRKATASLYPEVFFQEVNWQDLRTVDPATLPFPLIIKPAVGFFSMGVHHVETRNDWEPTLNMIEAEQERLQNVYPVDVFTSATYLIEEYISGDEFAVDAYLDGAGEPVILGIWKHRFAGDEDTGDRVYVSSREIMETWLKPMQDELRSIARVANLYHLPLHAEFRVAGDGQMVPIEINPCRFGGWCTTADITARAFGFNPYHYYLNSHAPDWKQILEQLDDRQFALVVLDNSTGVDHRTITAFDYDRLLANFRKPLELRRVNFQRYPCFGILFLEVPSGAEAELEFILHSDLSEFITV